MGGKSLSLGGFLDTANPFSQLNNTLEFGDPFASDQLGLSPQSGAFKAKQQAKTSSEAFGAIIKQLQGLGEEEIGFGLPFFQQGAGQAADVLQTGITDALRPAINNALETERQKTGQAQQATEENLARRGVTGTQLQETVAGQRLTGEQAVAAVPERFTLPVLQQAGQGTAAALESGLQQLQQAAAGQAGAASPTSAPNAFGGAISGAAAGSSIAPGWGTLIGGAAGGVLGASGGKQ